MTSRFYCFLSSFIHLSIDMIHLLIDLPIYNFYLYFLAITIISIFLFIYSSILFIYFIQSSINESIYSVLIVKCIVCIRTANRKSQLTNSSSTIVTSVVVIKSNTGIELFNKHIFYAYYCIPSI